MYWKFLNFLMGFSVWVLTAHPALAMYTNLSEGEKLEAINFGSSNSQVDITEFLTDWVVVLDDDKGVAFIITEFLALATEAKTAVQRGIALTQFDIEDAIARSSYKLVFRVTSFGNNMNFARDFTALVKTGKKTIHTTYWNNMEGEALGKGKNRPRFIADSDFYFPSEGIDPKSKITLVVQDEAGNTVSEYPFDLSKLR